MRILLTAGPTREPIDAVRYVGNRSSGRMGAALAAAALRQGHSVTMILGPVSVPVPDGARRIDVETAAQMHAAVLHELPAHDLLVMAAAVADYRPKVVADGKIGRNGSLTLELEATQDIVAAASRAKRADQRIVGFSLEGMGGVERARDKQRRKNLDLMVYNPTATMNIADVEAVLLFPDGRAEPVAHRSKAEFAEVLIERIGSLFE